MSDLSPLSGKADYMCSERLFWRAAVKERKPLTMATSLVREYHCRMIR